MILRLSFLCVNNPGLENRNHIYYNSWESLVFISLRRRNCVAVF